MFAFDFQVSVYVDKNNFRKGIGRKLYSELLSILKTQGFHVAIGCLTLPNPGSVKLHESIGFSKCGEFKDSGFKFNQWYNVGFWELMLDDYECNHQ